MARLTDAHPCGEYDIHEACRGATAPAVHVKVQLYTTGPIDGKRDLYDISWIASDAPMAAAQRRREESSPLLK